MFDFVFILIASVAVLEVAYPIGGYSGLILFAIPGQSSTLLVLQSHSEFLYRHNCSLGLAPASIWCTLITIQLCKHKLAFHVAHGCPAEAE